jgi:hypothetical protein
MANPKRIRSGENLNVWIRSDLVEALRTYIEATEPRTTKTAVVETSLIRFLKEKGHWPPPEPTPPD